VSSEAVLTPQADQHGTYTRSFYQIATSPDRQDRGSSVALPPVLRCIARTSHLLTLEQRYTKINAP
jgi:hypothetical protein